METLIHIGGRMHVEPSQVVLLTADKNYTTLFLENGKKLFVATTLKKIQSRLAKNTNFFRPNRGNLLNLNYMTCCTEKSITLENQQTFTITRRRQMDFLSILNK
jgi:DNA-binding LytR/AlgR family response regulator